MGHKELKPPESFEFTSQMKTMCGAATGVGVVVFIGAILMGQSHAAWNGYLIGLWFTLSLALAGPFILATQHLAIAGWSSTIRRIPEAFGSFVPFAFVLALGIFAGGAKLYHWWDPAYVMSDTILAKKAGFLNVGAFAFSLIAGFLTWFFTSRYLRQLSLAQDEEGGKIGSTVRMQLASVLFLLSFIVFFSVLSWYMIMGLEPHWFSTMFSVYCFAGLFQSGLALTVILTLWLKDKGTFGDYVGERQIHDLGQLLFGFTVFYMYITFSQFMLIWYANIPEEAIWYVARGIPADVPRNGWEYVSLFIPIAKFIVPFLVLLPQNNKKNKMNILRYMAFWLMFMQLFEVWYWVAPTSHEAGALSTAPSLGHAVVEWGVAIGFVGLFIGVVLNTLSKHPIVPKNDPFLNEAVKGHHHGVKPPKPREMVISK